MLTNAYAGQSHPVKSCLQKESLLLPHTTLPPRASALRELAAYYSSHFTSSSKICPHSSQRQQLSHRGSTCPVASELHLPFTPLVESRFCLDLAKTKELVTSESIWRIPFLFQTKTWRLENECYTNTTSLRQNSKAAAVSISWKPSNIAGEEDLLKAFRNN